MRGLINVSGCEDRGPSRLDKKVILKQQSTRDFDRQAAGHRGSVLKLADEENDDVQPRTVLKKLLEEEVSVYQALYSQDGDPIHEFIPQFLGEAQIEDTCCSKQTTIGRGDDDDVSSGRPGDRFIRLTNLLSDFRCPMVMDIKMGVRSFVEDECKSQKPRPDLLSRMLQLDPSEPTEAEEELGHITKFRWMMWRDRMSSSSTLGFRVDGFAGPGDQKLQHSDFMYIRTREHIVRELVDFLPPPRWRSSTERRSLALSSEDEVQPGRPRSSLQPRKRSRQEQVKAQPETVPVLTLKLSLAQSFTARLRQLKAACESSQFFLSHEFVGASLLLVAESDPPKVNVFLIDFAKTTPVPSGVKIDHRSQWVLGNHEDGFLTGLDNFIECWAKVVNVLQEDIERSASGSAGSS